LGAPKGIPKAALERLTRELDVIMKSPEWLALLANNGVAPGVGSPESFGERIKRDYEKFGRIAQGAGLKPQ
jgi:tripartite-type tricarboxylate transporter receptor subunit TctC